MGCFVATADLGIEPVNAAPVHRFWSHPQRLLRRDWTGCLRICSVARPCAASVGDIGVFGIPAIAEHHVGDRSAANRAVLPARPVDHDVAGQDPLVGNADRLAAPPPGFQGLESFVCRQHRGPQPSRKCSKNQWLSSGSATTLEVWRLTFISHRSTSNRLCGPCTARTRCCLPPSRRR